MAGREAISKGLQREKDRSSPIRAKDSLLLSAIENCSSVNSIMDALQNGFV